ncbi:hypothetical protein CPB84DRAFT_1751687 [Gymnopilus junonius]|uniref:Uncharacterized protein n=1 Tax=Gymnopilus junonius TaxID=109634 RepID=A0A9P5NEP7_GYMJU|nr:hypothetical protein CPB84DRAFT_1751687 [Gymnopilus junonius]
MDAFLGKTGKRLFEKHLQQYAPADPLYETYTTERGKQNAERFRALPPGLSKRDARILRKLMSRAHYLDKGFSILGMRFGYTFIVGLIPLVGDFADIGINYLLVIRPAQKLDIPGWLLRRMLLNNAVSAGVGLVPLVGDVFLAAYKANSRNVALVEEFLRIRGEEFIKMGLSADQEEESSGWFGFGKRKNKKGKPQLPSYKSPQERCRADQPGAGMTGPELKDQWQMFHRPCLFGPRKSKTPPVDSELVRHLQETKAVLSSMSEGFLDLQRPEMHSIQQNEDDPHCANASITILHFIQDFLPSSWSLFL